MWAGVPKPVETLTVCNYNDPNKESMGYKTHDIDCLDTVNDDQLIFSANEPYKKTMTGKSCKEDTRTQQISCTYEIGKDLLIWIAGIGSPDTSVTFAKSNFEGDYYATFGMLHHCVVVKSQGNLLQDFAFISPKNGKVYKDWKTCRTAY